MLRAIGVTQRQTRRMIRHEAVITALIGGALGIALGLVFGVLLVTRMPYVSFSLPTGQLILCGIAAVIIGIVAAIILFNLAIPPRVGLTMELAVGLMLILLGVLNLAGVTKWLSEKFSPAHPHVTGEHAHIHEHGSHLHYHWHEHAPAKEHHGDSLAASRNMRSSTCWT